MKNEKVGLFNVTDLIDDNPGCRATIEGLKKVLNVDLLNQFPLGFAYHFFEKNKSFFGTNNYEYNYKRFKNDRTIYQVIKTLDTILINAEGTIHSDSIGAMTLLSIVRLGKEMNKKVYVVNGSFYNLSSFLLKILKLADLIYVREAESYSYLNNNFIESKLVLDCAFLTKMNFEPDDTLKRKGCVFTPGVIFSYGHKKSSDELNGIIENQYKLINKRYNSPVFLMIEDKEILYAKLWKSLGGTVIDATKISVQELLKLLNTFELIISGRYHILLFGLMLNKKLIPLKSNTSKIVGLLKSINEKQDYFIQDINSNNIDLDYFYNFQLDLIIIKEKIQSDYLKVFNK